MIERCGCKAPGSPCGNLTDLAPTGKCSTYDKQPLLCERFRVGATPCKVLKTGCRRDVSFAKHCVLVRLERILLHSEEEEASLLRTTAF